MLAQEDQPTLTCQISALQINTHVEILVLSHPKLISVNYLEIALFSESYSAKRLKSQSR